MAIVAPHLLYGIALFVLLMVLLMVARPAHVFDTQGHPRPFGCGPDQTMFPLGVVTVLMAVVSIYAFAVLEMLTL